MAVAVFENESGSSLWRTGALALLIDAFDRWNEPIPPKKLLAILGRYEIRRRDLKPILRFSKIGYARNRIHTTPQYEILALCWRSGQRSPIHDHRGSACGFQVVEGIATETVFDVSPCGLVWPVRSKHWETGTVRASYDADTHQMGNLQPAGTDLVTLHVYSPPLRGMRTYFLGDSVVGEYQTLMHAAAALRGSLQSEGRRTFRTAIERVRARAAGYGRCRTVRR